MELINLLVALEVQNSKENSHEAFSQAAWVFHHCENTPWLTACVVQIILGALKMELDYCNGLFIRNKYTKKLQYIQNSAARVLMRVRIYEHVTPILCCTGSLSHSGSKCCCSPTNASMDTNLPTHHSTILHPHRQICRQPPPPSSQHQALHHGRPSLLLTTL